MFFNLFLVYKNDFNLDLPTNTYYFSCIIVLSNLIIVCVCLMSLMSGVV